MRRKFVHIAAFALVLALLAGTASAAAGSAAVAAIDSTVIRVGLAYGSTALDGANLANSTGSGFRLGYFDSSNQFVQLGTTDHTAVSVVMTRNAGYGSSGGYTSYHTALAGSASVVVGCYHLQLPGEYATFAEAREAAGAYPDGFPAYIGGTFYARVGNFPDADSAKVRQQELAGDGTAEGVETTVVGTSSYGVSVVITKTNTVLFQFDDQGKGTGLGIMPDAAGDQPGLVTLFNTQAFGGRPNNKWYGGFRYERVSGGKMVVVNMVRLGDYLKGVVPIEVSSSWPIEAQKAQACAARTYALSNLNRHSSYHFDICPTTHCQAYSGLARSAAASDRAVEETAGVTVKYNGRYCDCTYYSSNGGASMSAKDVWGSDYPYLQGKADPYKTAAKINNAWSRTYTFAELTSKLGYASTITAAKITRYTDYGNPLSIVFYTQNGKTYTMTTYQLVRALSLTSYRYDFGPNGGNKTDAAVTGPSGGFSVNGSAASGGMDGMYAIDGGGNIAPVPGGAYVITGDGRTSTVENWSGGAGDDGLYHGTNGSFVISGRGSGHNVGMSQWGAYAMAKQGFTYKQILEFYYTGVTVG